MRTAIKYRVEFEGREDVELVLVRAAVSPFSRG